MNKIYKEAVSRQPEYERLGIEPKTGGTSLLHDEIGEPLVRQQPGPRIPAAESITNEKVLIKHDESKEEPRLANPLTARRKPIPSSGFVDQMWMDGKPIEKSDEEIPDSAIIDNNDVVNIDALQGIDPLASVRARAKVVVVGPDGKPIHLPKEKSNTQTIKQNIPEPETFTPEELEETLKYDKELQEKLSQIPEEKEYNRLEDLDEGDYAVVFRNGLAAVTDTLPEAAEEAERILMQDGVTLEDISVYKRLKLSFGVTING
jgi:hypothetical protein